MRYALLGAVGWSIWNFLAPPRFMAPVYILLVGILVALAHSIWRLSSPSPLSHTAAVIDRRAGLRDELKSAFWFLDRADNSWRRLQIARAARSASELDVGALFPRARPPRLVLILTLAVLLLALQLVPLSSILGSSPFAADSSAAEEQLQLLSEDAESPFAEEDLTEDDLMSSEAEESLERSSWPGLEELLALLEDEELPLEEGLEPEASLLEADPQGERGESDAQEASLDEEAAAKLPEEEFPPGPGEAESEDMRLEQQEGGEAATDEVPLMPGSDEVFLQDEGEDLIEADLGDEEVGHSTKNPDGEKALEEGDLASLEVQLRLEIIRAEELQEPEEQPEEEPEERDTRAAPSTVSFRTLVGRGDFADQELLSSDSLPWRYRKLVLAYFRSLRQREKEANPR